MHHCTLVGFQPERRFRIIFFVPGLRPLKMLLHNCSRNCRISLHTVRLLQFAENKTYWPRSHTFWPYPSSGSILTLAHLTGLCSTVTGGDVFVPVEHIPRVVPTHYRSFSSFRGRSFLIVSIWPWPSLAIGALNQTSLTKTP